MTLFRVEYIILIEGKREKGFVTSRSFLMLHEGLKEEVSLPRLLLVFSLPRVFSLERAE
jgi:hypothetical protein